MMKLCFWLLFVWVVSARSNVSNVVSSSANPGSGASGTTNLAVMGNQSENIRALCLQSLIMSASQFQLPVTNGEITVYCLWSTLRIEQMISAFFHANGHLTTSAEVLGATNKSLSYLQRDSFVSICLLDCLRGKPYQRFNYLSQNLDEPNHLNIGCDDVENMKCKETCPPFLSDVENGMVSCSEGLFHESVCYLRCNAGFISRGTVEKKCNASVPAWFPDRPYICDATCPLLALAAANGQVNCTDSAFLGSVCALQCDKGYEPRGPTEKRCLPGQNMWSTDESFQCSVVSKPSTCTILLPPENGKVECTHNHSLFSKCATSCNVGYNPRLPVEYWCLPDQTRERSSWYIFRGNTLPQRTAQTSSCKETTSSNIAPPFQTATLEDTDSSLQPKLLARCRISIEDRRPCGNISITYGECKSNRCCWDFDNDLWFRCYQSSGRWRGRPASSARATGNLISPSRNSNSPSGFVSARFVHEEVQTYRSVSVPHFVAGSESTNRHNRHTPCGCKKLTFPNTRLCSNLDPYVRHLNSVRSLGRRPVTRISHSLCGDASTTAGHWPWHAVVYFYEELCGGTLIAPQYVVTAAHCFFPDDGSQDNITQNKYVGLGSTNISDNTDPHLQIRTIERIVRHPNYMNLNGYLRNDIAILKLDRPVDVNGIYARPLCMPNDREPIVTDECFAAGFGNQGYSGARRTSILQAVRLPLIPKDLCRPYYKGLSIDYAHLCAGGTTPGDSDTCHGDSGGALACRDINSSGACHWYLAGITSFGKSICGQGIPGVYTNVYNYQGWIRDTILRLTQD